MCGLGFLAFTQEGSECKSDSSASSTSESSEQVSDAVSRSNGDVVGKLVLKKQCSQCSRCDGFNI